MLGTELSCVPNDTCASEVLLQGCSAVGAVPSLKPCMGHQNYCQGEKQEILGLYSCQPIMPFQGPFPMALLYLSHTNYREKSQ